MEIRQNEQIPHDIICAYGDGQFFSRSDLIKQLEIYSIKHGLKNGLDDLMECPTPKFNNILKDIGRYFINPLNILKVPNDKTRNGLYKYDNTKLEALTDVYIELCYEYDKQINIIGLTNLINGNSRVVNTNNRIYNNIDNNISANNKSIYIDSIDNIDPLDRTLNIYQLSIEKKLLLADASLQENKARDSKQAILNIAYNNYKHSWNGQIKANEIKSTVKSLDEIRENRLKIAQNDTQQGKLSYSDID